MSAGHEIVTSVLDVVRSNVCTGCGTCAGVCPTRALQMTINRSGIYVPEIDLEICTLCGLCLAVCPEISPLANSEEKKFVLQHDFANLTEFVFESLSADQWLGHCRGYYLAHALDETVRYSAASGGAVTSLLVNALCTGYIDGALVVGMRPDSPLIPQVIIARTPEEVTRAARSKYCPVPLNAAIREVLHFKGRLAVVGLPCHVRGFRKAAMCLPQLKKVILYMGLACFHGVTFQGTRFLLARLGLDHKQVAEIEYRGRGWPGSVLVRMKNGLEYTVDYNEAWSTAFGFFSPLNCFTCYDGANELADISAADAWIPQLRAEHGRNPGESLLIVRSLAGQELLAQAIEKGLLEVRPLTRKDALASLQGPLLRKKLGYASRLHVMRWLGLSTPKIGSTGHGSSVRLYVHSLFELGFTLLFARPQLCNLLKYAPSVLLKAVMFLDSMLLPKGLDARHEVE